SQQTNNFDTRSSSIPHRMNNGPGEREMIVKEKVALIFGAGGDVGGAVARAFPRDGAKLFLSGRHLPKVEAIAADIIGRGGVAEAAQVDVLDEQAVDKYVGAGRAKAGGLDLPFHAISNAPPFADRAPPPEAPPAHFWPPNTAYTV